ncbi:MAG: hypothetical protein HFI75_12605 [Lachnospiraceae bacterium]|nr:hypothetical protein [Lachnospiraceae bacterium]
MKIPIKHIRQAVKRTLAGLLSSAMLLTSLPAATFAEEAAASVENEYDAILKMLAEEDPEIAKQYPAGLFKFDTLLAEMNENSQEPLKLYLVRHGGTEGEATVNVKFSDYSARYGQDYTARLAGAEEDIAANPESQPLLYLLGSGDAEENLRKSYGSYDAMVETLGQEKVDRMEDLLRQYAADKEEADEAGQETPAVSEESPLYQLNEQVSQYAQGGVDTEQVWQTQQSMDAATAKLSWGMMEEVFPGTEVDVTFADGEQIKEIIVSPINNDTSDGERIFSVILNDITNQNSGIDSDNTVSVTMHDDEASALSKIHVDTTSLPEYITPGSGTFTVTLKREEALYNTATANFFAVTDNNVVLQSGKIIFMPGMDEQKVEIDTAKAGGAASVSLYFDAESTIGCEAAGNASIPIQNGEPGVEALAETSGVVYNAENSPIGFAGEGTYSGFNIFPSDENFVKGSDTAGPQHKNTRNSYNSNEKYWDLYIPDCTCSYKGQRNYMQSKWSFPTFDFVQSLALDLVASDQEPSTCNRLVFSTNDNYNIGYTDQGQIDNLGGVWCFAGDYDNDGKPLTVNNDGEGGFSGKMSFKSDQSKIGVMGTRMGKENTSSRGGKLKFAVWKTSGGVNGEYMKLYGIRVNYKQFNFRVEIPDKSHLDNKSPGVLHIESRDAKSNNQTDQRYALEKLSFVEVAENDKFELTGMQFQDKDGNWINISSRYFNAKEMTLTLNASFYSDYASYFKDNLPNGSTIVLRPVYQGRQITVTINTDEHGGMMFDGKYYRANSGTHQVSANAGLTVSIGPYDVKQGWHFSMFDGNKSDLYVANDTRQIEFQQNKENQTLELGLYNYVLTPRFTESGTNVKIKVGKVPAGCEAPKETEFSLDQGNLKGAGEFLQFQAKVGSGCRAVWKVKTRDHTWQNRTFYGETFDYSVINGDNEIELSFEVMKYDHYVLVNNNTTLRKQKQEYAPSYTALNGQVLGYQGTILNPPQSNGRGGYSGEGSPIANAVVSMGKYTARTDKDGKFRLYSYEEDTNGDGVNEQYYLQAYANEDHTVRVTCNNMTQIYIINTGRYSNVEKSLTTKPRNKFQRPETRRWYEPAWSSDSAKPYECALSKGITTTFYGNGPTPSNFYVLTGADEKTPPTSKNRIASVPMSNTTIGFELEVNNVSEETPLSRVDYKIYDRDGNLRDSSTFTASLNHKANGKVNCTLDRFYTYEDGVQTGYMYFNGLLNFHDGDRIFVELIRTEYDAEGNAIDFSYGEYDTGVRFYEVPGQGLETTMPSVETVSENLPDLPMIGSISPGFNAGPLSVKATISEDTMEFSVGFNVATFTKVANAKQLAEKAKAKATQQEAQQLEELDQSLEDGDITPEDYVVLINQMYEAGEEPQDPMQPAPGVQEEARPQQEPTAQQMKDPSKFARNQFGDSFQKNISEFNKIIDKIKAGDKKSAALKDATTQSNGAIPVIINVTVGVTVRMVADEEITHQWVFDSATIYAQFSLTVTATFYMDVPAVPIPIYVGFSFTVSLGLYNTIQAKYQVSLSQMTSGEDYDADMALGYSGNVPMTIAIEGFVGVGIRKLLALEIGVGYVQQFSFGFGDKAVGVGISTFYGYTEVSLVIFNARWKYAQASWKYLMYNDSAKQAQQAQIMSVMDETAGEAMNAELASLTLNQEQYASTFTGGMKLRSTLQQEHTDTILTDAPNIESQVIPLGDGRALMVYEGVDNSRTQYNRNAVFYSIYNGSFWSEPQVLQQDGTLDMGLTVEDMGENFVISWSSAEKTYEESDLTDGTTTDEDGNVTVNPDALLEVLSSMDIYAIVLDKAEVTDDAIQNAIKRITKDNPLEEERTLGFAHENPNAVELEDGRILLFYTSSDYNTYGDDQPISNLNELLSAPGMMMYRIYENGEWSEEYYSTETAYQGEDMKEQWYGQRLADINLKDNEGNIYYPITGYADVTTVVRGGEEKVLITYVVDTDGNISTSTDRIVCMSVMTPPSELADSTTSLPIQLSSTGIPVSNTKFQKAFSDFGEITLITFTQGDNLVYLDLNRLFNGITLSEEDEVDASFTDQDTVGIVESTLTVNGKEIPYYTLKEGVAPVLAVKGDGNTSLSNGFASASGEDGNVYLAWTDSDGEEQHILVSALNVEAAKNGSYELKWSSPKKMNLRNANEETDPNAEGYEPVYAMNPSIAVDEQGNMIIIHNRFDLELDTGTDENGKEVAIGKHKENNRLCAAFAKAVGSLEWSESESGDPAVSAEAVTLSEEYPQAGTTFTATAQICNKGLLAAEEVNVNANLVTLDQDGNEVASVPAKRLLKPDGLEIRVNGAITAEFDMTQEMIDNAVNNGYKYKVVMDVCESNFVDQTITAEAQVKVGSRLEMETNYIHGMRTHKVILGDDKKTTIDDVFDSNNRYMISATLHNTGNVDSAAPEISLEMENKNAFITDGFDNKEMSVEEKKDYLEKAPMNASLINNEDHQPYVPISGTIAEDITGIEVGQSTDVTVISKKIPDSYYSDRGAATFLLGVTDQNSYDPEHEIPHYVSFTQTVGDYKEPRIKENQEVVYEVSMEAGTAKNLTLGSVKKDSVIKDAVEWKSSNEAVATVDENGTVTATGNGVTVVTAKTGNHEAKLRVTVSGAKEEPDEPSGSETPGTEEPPAGGDTPGNGEPPAGDNPSGNDGSGQNPPDADVPAGVTKNDVKNIKTGVSTRYVRTGDPADLRIWIALLWASGGAVCAGVYRRRKKLKKSNKG